jgi:hypothetical protein
VGIRLLIDERFGDGIMSAIDLYAAVTEARGAAGERRVVLTLNGKFLPHIEQVGHRWRIDGAAAAYCSHCGASSVLT